MFKNGAVLKPGEKGFNMLFYLINKVLNNVKRFHCRDFLNLSLLNE